MTVLRPDIAEPEPTEDDVQDRCYDSGYDRTGWATHALPNHALPNHALPNHNLPNHNLPGHAVSSHALPVSPHPMSRNGGHPAAAEPAPQPASADLTDSSKLIRLHESIGNLLASRGEWQQAYHHLRSALDLVYSDRIEQPPVPEQLRREVDRLRKEHAEAREQSIRDSLTASYNRRYLDQRLTSMLADSSGDGGAGLAVALVDLDWFKSVNDTFGHLVGDRVLQRVVDLLSDDLPDGAFCARYGGEEFVLVVPGIDAYTAIEVAEAARARIERHPWPQLAPGLRVTVSIGLAHEPTGTRRTPTSAEQQLLRADGLLYAAKQSGRNAVAFRRAGRVVLTNGRRVTDVPLSARHSGNS